MRDFSIVADCFFFLRKFFRIHYLHYVHWLQFNRSIWAYPILDELSFVGRCIFLMSSAIFTVILYFLGEKYTQWIRGEINISFLLFNWNRWILFWFRNETRQYRAIKEKDILTSNQRFLFIFSRENCCSTSNTVWLVEWSHDEYWFDHRKFLLWNIP